MAKIKVGDTVMVRTGRNKGKTGEVSQILPRSSRVIVKGLNIRTKHLKPSATRQTGGIEKSEQPIDISNVALLHPVKKNKPSRVGFEFKKDGTKIRVHRQASNKEVK